MWGSKRAWGSGSVSGRAYTCVCAVQCNAVPVVLTWPKSGMATSTVRMTEMARAKFFNMLSQSAAATAA